MVRLENEGRTNNTHWLSRQFETEILNKPAYMEIHKSHGKVIGLVFHVGEFSVPILRSRPYQRIYDQVDSNPLRPWVMGRVTYNGKVLLENPGRPGIFLKGIPGHLPGARCEGNDDLSVLSPSGRNLLSTALWINGDRINFRELFPKEDRGYFYKEVAVVTTPVLEQSFQTDVLKVTTEIIPSSVGPVQRTTVEALEEASVELDYCFMGIFPEGVTKYYAHDNSGKPFGGNLEYPSKGSNTANVSIPHARWLAVYNPDRQFGTLVCSPEFEKEAMSHLLVADRRQGLKVYHVVGDCESFAKMQPRTESAKLTISPGHPQQLTLFARPIEADADEWKARAEEEALGLINELSLRNNWR